MGNLNASLSGQKGHICYPPVIFSYKFSTRIKQVTLMIETNRPSHSDNKKLDHFNEITSSVVVTTLHLSTKRVGYQEIVHLEGYLRGSLW